MLRGPPAQGMARGQAGAAAGSRPGQAAVVPRAQAVAGPRRCPRVVAVADDVAAAIGGRASRAVGSSVGRATASPEVVDRLNRTKTAGVVGGGSAPTATIAGDAERTRSG